MTSCFHIFFFSKLPRFDRVTIDRNFFEYQKKNKETTSMSNERLFGDLGDILFALWFVRIKDTAVVYRLIALIHLYRPILIRMSTSLVRTLPVHRAGNIESWQLGKVKVKQVTWKNHNNSANGERDFYSLRDSVDVNVTVGLFSLFKGSVGGFYPRPHCNRRQIGSWQSLP